MDVGIQVLILVWIVLLVVTLQWGRSKGRGANLATWAGMTVVAWWLEFVVAFVALHAILFALGREVTAVVIVVTLGVMTLTPAACAHVLSNWNRARTAHE